MNAEFLQVIGLTVLMGIIVLLYFRFRIFRMRYSNVISLVTGIVFGTIFGIKFTIIVLIAGAIALPITYFRPKFFGLE